MKFWICMGVVLTISLLGVAAKWADPPVDYAMLQCEAQTRNRLRATIDESEVYARAKMVCEVARTFKP